MEQRTEELDNLRKILKQTIIQNLQENHREMFALASGKKSPYYFDLKATLLHPLNLKIASRALMLLMMKEAGKLPDAVGGLTMGADPLVYTISVLSGDLDKTIYPLIVRKQTKDHGSKKRIEGLVGEIGKDANVILIDDVITTGKSTIEALNVIREAGFNPVQAFCVVDRMEGGRENLANTGVTLFSLFNLNDFSSMIS